MIHVIIIPIAVRINFQLPPNSAIASAARSGKGHALVLLFIDIARHALLQHLVRVTQTRKRRAQHLQRHHGVVLDEAEKRSRESTANRPSSMTRHQPSAACHR